MQKQVDRAIARKKIEDAAAIDLAHVELPSDIIAAAETLDEVSCRKVLWRLADEIAREEGFAHREGLQKRAAQIMGVTESQASKMYSEGDHCINHELRFERRVQRRRSVAAHANRYRERAWSSSCEKE